MDFKSSNYSEALKKFADWIESAEKRLNSACHCCPQPPQPPQSMKTVINFHKKLQDEVEEYGKQLNYELKRHLKENNSSTEEQSAEVTKLEERWHKLWLLSLEQLVVVERTKRCPMHNSTIIGKSSLSPANRSVAKPQRQRPISFPSNPSDRLEWDYKHTLILTGCHKENGSQIDLDSVDDQVTKNLTEFGDDYEVWLAEDGIACVPVHSRPPSIEPTEKPELAQAVITSDNYSQNDVNRNLLMLTTPSSMVSVDASKCLHQQKQSYTWRIMGSFLVALAFLVFSALHQEPHQMHKSYYHSQPPV